MIIVIKEETKLGMEYSSLKDDNGKACKFKALADAEERVKSAFEANPLAVLVILNS